MENAIQTTQQAVVSPSQTLALAIEKGLDPVTIGKMMDLQERWEAGQARKAFVEAMSGFKRDCPSVIGKDKRADFGAGRAKYSYATTGAIVTAITPALSKHGLHLSWETKQQDKAVTVTCHITHEGGHRESATLTGPNDESGGKNPIQMVGSSVHYLQRYTMVSVLGLATADMDDPDATPRVPVSMPVEKSVSDKTDSSEQVDGFLEDVVEIKSKPGAAKAWTKWGIKINGETYGTFDRVIGEAAELLKGQAVSLLWRHDGQYKTAVRVWPCVNENEGADVSGVM